MPITFINNGSGNISFNNVNNSGTVLFSVASVVTNPATGSPWEQINSIISYLRSYVTDFRNPQFFTYRLDGNAYQIVDGGQDMFDNGNYTAPWLRAGTNYITNQLISIPPALPYSSQSATLTDTNYYFAAFGYTQSAGTFPAAQNAIYHPLTMIGARSGSGPIGWQKAGNIGADGLAGSQIQTGSIYTGSVINGFTTYAYYRQTWGQSNDPNICDVYMLFGHPNWNSNFGTVAWSASLSTQIQGATLYATGSASNILAVTTLLSRTGSNSAAASLPISASQIATVVDNFALRIKEALSF